MLGLPISARNSAIFAEHKIVLRSRNGAVFSAGTKLSGLDVAITNASCRPVFSMWHASYFVTNRLPWMQNESRHGQPTRLGILRHDVP